MLGDIIGDIVSDVLTGSGCIGRIVSRLAGLAFLLAGLLLLSRAFQTEGLTFVVVSLSGMLISVGLLLLTSDRRGSRARLLGFGLLAFFLLTIAAVLHAGLTGRL